MGAPRLQPLQVDLSVRTPGPGEIASTVALGEALQPEALIKTANDLGLLHIVQKGSIEFDREVAASEEMIVDKKKYLDDPLKVIFGQKDRESRESFSMSFDAGEKKTALLTSFGDYVAGLQGSRAIWDQALLIADELYTNGSKNAWPRGSKLFDGPPTNSGTIDFFAEADAKRLIFGCRDSFGALDVRSVVARIWSCYENGVAGSIRHGVGGAGIGSYMVFDSCISYYAGVDSGKRTVVCVALPLGLSRRSASGLFKNIHLLP